MSWVDSALQTLKRPVAAKDLSVDARFGADGAPENPFLRALQRDLARLNVRRIANRHDCEGTCKRPEHAADVEFAAEVLDILGLTYEPPAAVEVEPEPEPAPEPAPAPTSKRCSGCDAVKPLEEFNRESRRPDGLSNTCRECTRRVYKAARERRKRADKAIPDQKVCSGCGELKDSSEFHRDASAATGLTSCCKPCKLARNERYQTPKGAAA